MSNGGYCTECGFHVDTFEGLNGCPSCGTKGLPCPDDWQITVSVNWHELRILSMWAENWQRQHQEQNPTRVVYAIADRLRLQVSSDFPPLTMAAELGDVAKHFPGMQVSDPRLRQDIAEQTGQEVNLIDKKE